MQITLLCTYLEHGEGRRAFRLHFQRSRKKLRRELASYFEIASSLPSPPPPSPPTPPVNWSNYGCINISTTVWNARYINLQAFPPTTLSFLLRFLFSFIFPFLLPLAFSIPSIFFFIFWSSFSVSSFFVIFSFHFSMFFCFTFSFVSLWFLYSFLPYYFILPF